MAVKRAGALLSDPKLEDEGSKSTNQHEGPKNDEPCLSLQRKRIAKPRYLSLLAK
jgi:hypothetical protein